jgi:hypothetical protein
VKFTITTKEGEAVVGSTGTAGEGEEFLVLVVRMRGDALVGMREFNIDESSRLRDVTSVTSAGGSGVATTGFIMMLFTAHRVHWLTHLW